MLQISLKIHLVNLYYRAKHIIKMMLPLESTETRRSSQIIIVYYSNIVK